ncbi:MAG: HAMP domain-containing protein [Gammaproteobacteria bacterium]|nr:MAG: HAMP domain-containing protein [Gammaproteobacteria bacterium]
MENKIVSGSGAKKSLRFRFSIRAKLFSLLLIPFFIPVIGYSFIKKQEQVLRENEQSLLADYARIAATVLTRHKDHFSRSINIESLESAYAHLISYSPLLDGYFDDWPEHLQPALSIKPERSNVSEEHLAAEKSFEPTKVYLATDTKSYYLFISVADNSIHYFNPEQPKNFEQITFFGSGDRFKVFTAAPGKILAKRVGGNGQLTNELRVKGHWVETDKGYNLEIKIPKNFLGNSLGFELTNVSLNAKGNKIISKYGTESSYLIASPSQEIQDSLTNFTKKGLRFWVSDLDSNVLASTGNIKDGLEREKESFMTTIRKAIYRLVLKQPTINFAYTRVGSGKLSNLSSQRALEGTPYQNRYATADERVVIMSAAHPVIANGTVIGAVTVEKTSNKILSLHNKAMESIIDISILAFIVTLAILLYLTTHISRRILRLRNYTQSSISSDGRVIANNPQPVPGSDEISELTDSFQGMIERVSQYNEYLENMAGRLSHELKTPLAIVSSSLDNMSLCTIPDDLSIYHQRAVDGINRLRHILLAMSEATRLEQSLGSTSRELVDIAEIIRSYCQGFQSCFSEIKLQINLPDTPVKINGNKDLIAQLLDKLLANAIDFHMANTPIKVELSTSNSLATISVINHGKTIPEGEIQQIFSPMVSLRDKSSQSNNLGLGLYIAQLICKYHHGHIYAENLKDDSSVALIVTVPISNN